MTKYYEIPEYSFSKTGNNEEVIINIGTEEEVNIEDLLRREIRQPDEQLLKVNIEQKNVLVTGASASII